MKAIFPYKVILLLMILCLSIPPECKAYSVLTHEALIDASWDKYFVPLLKKKYSLTDEQLKEAHAYAYGGAVMPDMGYYPFGSKLFTNLVHYVRSGDFVEALLNEAQNANEYAFALGAMCHYYADTYGHSLGVNISVPIVYPKVKKKFGDTVTYEEDPASHKRVEFAFDVTQTAKGNYASQAYHDFIGFKVADSVLDRAFYKTYDLHLTDIFSNFSRAVGTFRWAVKDFFPLLTRAAWATKKEEIKKSQSGITARKFKYKMNRVNYNKEYGRDRDKPGFFSYTLSVLIRILPKIGPLKPLKFVPPGPVAEKYYIQSFDTVQKHINLSIDQLHYRRVYLPDRDFDTGEPTTPGEYGLADKTYRELLLKLEDKKFDSLSVALKQNIVHYFNKADTLTERQNLPEDQKVNDALTKLKTTIPVMNNEQGTRNKE